MPSLVVIGAQWGDEGKGKIVDLFTEHAQLVVRYGGGPNAGHTLVVGNDKVIVRLVPSGVLRRDVRCVLAQGMVIDPWSLLGEIDELKKRGYVADGQLVVSDRAHAILPYHVLVDGLREKGAGAIGTTKRGVGPCVEDKVGRRGVVLGALRDLAACEKTVARALNRWGPEIAAAGERAPAVADVMAKIAEVQPRIVPLLASTAKIVDDALRAGQRVMFEGAQGTLLDVNHGTYPFVTSTNPTAGGAATGSGVGPTRLGRVVGLVKAYLTRVGGGPFPTELTDETGERLRQVGAEFGSVTGRPRRTGWIDLPALRYAARINGLDAVALTKLDVLTGLPRVKACVAYDTPGGVTDELPLDELDRATPRYEELPGWSADLSRARSLDDLPPEARRYVRFLEEAIGVPITLVSVGQRRDETIVVSDPWAGA